MRIVGNLTYRDVCQLQKVIGQVEKSPPLHSIPTGRQNEMAGKSVLEKIRAEDQKIADAKARRDKMVEKARHNMGLLAEKAGLFEVDVSDKELLKAFQEIAARFRKEQKPAKQAQLKNPQA